jgi:hypothetical protein
VITLLGNLIFRSSTLRVYERPPTVRLRDSGGTGEAPSLIIAPFLANCACARAAGGRVGDVLSPYRDRAPTCPCCCSKGPQPAPRRGDMGVLGLHFSKICISIVRIRWARKSNHWLPFFYLACTFILWKKYSHVSFTDRILLGLEKQSKKSG